MTDIKIKEKEIRKAIFTSEVLTIVWSRKRALLVEYLKHVNNAKYLETRMFKNELARLTNWEIKFLASVPSFNFDKEYISAEDYVKELIGEL